MDRSESQTTQLTPVRIRGKNTRDRPHKKKPNEDSSTPEPSRPRGRPPKRMSTAVVLSSSHSTASSSSTKRRRRAAKPPRDVMLSPLELLPVELLQSVFLYSLNLALPLCSPRLASALSSKHVRMELVTRAFCNNVRRGTDADDPIFRIDQDDAELLERYKSLQSGLLRLKWMTPDLFKECIDTFLIRIAAREFLAPLTKDGLGEPLPTMAEYHTLLEEVHICGIACIPSTQPECWLGGVPMCNVRTLERRLRDGRVLRLQINRPSMGFYITTHKLLPDGTRSGGPSCFDKFKILSPSWLTLKTDIPSRLLHGPWTNETCEFLEMLLKMGFSVDWLYSTDGEIAENGLEHAIRERNRRALGLLVAFDKLPGFERQDEEGREGEWEFERGHTVQKVDGYEHIPVLHLSMWHVGVLPRISHLRLAVIECDCPPDIVYHLLLADTRRLDLEDRELVGWAVEKRKQGDWRGKWLLKLLRKASVWDSPAQHTP